MNFLFRYTCGYVVLELVIRFDLREKACDDDALVYPIKRWMGFRIFQGSLYVPYWKRAIGIIRAVVYFSSGPSSSRFA